MSVKKRSSVYFEGEASCNNGSEDEDEVNDDRAGTSLNDFIVEDEGDDSTDQSSESESIAPVVSKKRGRPKNAKPVSTKKIIKEVTEEKLIGHTTYPLTKWSLTISKRLDDVPKHLRHLNTLTRTTSICQLVVNFQHSFIQLILQEMIQCALTHVHLHLLMKCCCLLVRSLRKQHEFSLSKLQMIDLRYLYFQIHLKIQDMCRSDNPISYPIFYKYFA